MLYQFCGPWISQIGSSESLTDWRAGSCLFCNATRSSSRSFGAEIHIPISQTSLYTWPLIQTLNLAWRWGGLVTFLVTVAEYPTKATLGEKGSSDPRFEGALSPWWEEGGRLILELSIFAFSPVRDPSPWDAASSIQSWTPPGPPLTITLVIPGYFLNIEHIFCHSFYSIVDLK